MAALGQEPRATTISVAEIRPGMRGYGLTVFRGTQPERFQVTVIDVLHNFRPDQDLILVRTDHPILDHASTVAGMSGSPIYLDNRLAGAYAYGWPFGKDPVAGVTPIASMLAEMRRPLRSNAFPGARPIPTARARPSAARPRFTRSRLAGLSPYLGGARRSALQPLEEHGARMGLGPVATADSPRRLVRAATPIMMGGLDDSVVDELGARLERFGLVTLQTGGSAPRADRGQRARPSAASHFIDGGAIGVQLIRGDVNATAIGTVTHVAGQRLVAFGHPMMNAGEIGLPTCTARVLHILASENRSFKIAEGLDPLGTLTHDRQAAIVVDSNLAAATVPVRVRIHGVDGAPRTEWNMEVVSHRVLTPMLVFAAIENAVKASVGDEVDMMFTGRSRVSIERHGQVDASDVGWSAAGASDAGALGRLRLFSFLEAAYGNPFEDLRATGVDLDLYLRFARDVTEIVDASVATDEVDPGGRVNVHVRVRPYGRPETVRVVPVEIPTAAAGQEIEIAIQPGDDVAIEQPDPRNVDDILDIVRRAYPATSMVVSVKMPSRGLRLQGHVVRSLPRSALDALQLANESDPGESFTTYDRRAIDAGHVLAGAARLRLRVREIPRPPL